MSSYEKHSFNSHQRMQNSMQRYSLLGMGMALCLASIFSHAKATFSRSPPAAAAAVGLRAGYYALSCPNLESMVRVSFTTNFLQDITAPAALLRLAFHDCQVGGCDASILLNSSRGEMASDRNFGIRRLDFIDNVKALVEASCPGVVSCADILALVARDSIAISGGPYIPLPLGRRDSRTTLGNAGADRLIPRPSISVNDFLALFQAMGMTTEESVAILGAHSIGVGHCVNVADRLYPTPSPSLRQPRAAQLQQQCPSADPRLTNNATILPIDSTSVFFDSQYFRDLTAGQALFEIDANLALDTRTSRAVANFAINQPYFFTVFTNAFTKMLSSNVLTGSSGEIRRNCRLSNT